MPRRRGRKPKNYDPNNPHLRPLNSYYMSIKNGLGSGDRVDKSLVHETPLFH